MQYIMYNRYDDMIKRICHEKVYTYNITVLLNSKNVGGIPLIISDK